MGHDQAADGQTICRQTLLAQVSLLASFPFLSLIGCGGVRDSSALFCADLSLSFFGGDFRAHGSCFLDERLTICGPFGKGQLPLQRN